MDEIEVNLKIFIKENGELRVTATASKYEQEHWTPISITDDEADRVVLGNTTLIDDIKRMCKSKASAPGAGRCTVSKGRAYKKAKRRWIAGTGKVPTKDETIDFHVGFNMGWLASKKHTRGKL